MIFYRYLFFGLVAIALLQSAFYYPQLPATVASHWGASGDADGWSSRSVFFAIYLSMVALVAVVFILIPHWTGRRGAMRMNIPNRDYWLAPERAQATKAFFRRQMLILGIAHLALAIYTVQLAIIANLRESGRLDDSIVWALGLYFAFLAGWLLHLILHFRKP